MRDGFLDKIEDFEKFYDTLCDYVCKKYGITQTAFQILYFLSRFPEHNTAKEICNVRCIKSSIASMTIDKLVKNEYLMRKSDPDDRRIQRLELMPKANDIIQDGICLRDQVMDILFQELTQEEHDLFFLVLDKIHDSVQKIVREQLIKI